MKNNKGKFLIAPFLPASVVAWREVGDTRYNRNPMVFEELDWLGGISEEASANGGGLPMGEGYFIHERPVALDDDENFDMSAYCLQYAHCTPDDKKYLFNGEKGIGIFSDWDSAAVAAGVDAWKRGLFLPVSAESDFGKKSPFPGVIWLDEDGNDHYYFGDMDDDRRKMMGSGFHLYQRSLKTADGWRQEAFEVEVITPKTGNTLAGFVLGGGSPTAEILADPFAWLVRAMLEEGREEKK